MLTSQYPPPVLSYTFSLSHRNRPWLNKGMLLLFENMKQAIACYQQLKAEDMTTSWKFRSHEPNEQP